MEPNETIEPVTNPEGDTIPFPVGVGKVFIVGAALGAGIYGGKLLIDWVAMKIVFRNRPQSWPEVPNNN